MKTLSLKAASIEYVLIGRVKGVIEMPFKCVRANVKSMDAYACGGLEIDFFAYIINECQLRKFEKNFQKKKVFSNLFLDRTNTRIKNIWLKFDFYNFKVYKL